MAKYCDDDCMPICDFCVHYRDDNEGKDGFAGEGYCEAKNEQTDACDFCEDDFHCFRLTEEAK